MAAPFLEIRGVKKSFGAHQVLTGIDLQAERGSITTIMGKSGIGKSVLLKCIAGIYSPDAGEILIDGKPGVGARSRSPDAPRLSYLFQGNALFDSLTAMENVALPLLETTKTRPRKAREQVLALFELLDLGDVANQYPGEMSGGMQKRVALARALITQPQLILFDEPTTGLDPQRKNSVFTMIADYRRKFDFTAVIVSHDIPEVLFISDRVAWMDRGQIRFVGAPTELEQVRDPALLDFVHHRNELLSDLAGQRGRSALFADWPQLRQAYDSFIVANCATERRRPGSELGLRRFVSYKEAVAAVGSIGQKHSQVYFLDERHFGFAIEGKDPESVRAEVERVLQSVSDGSSSNLRNITRYRWGTHVYQLAYVLSPAALWTLEENAAAANPHPLHS
jgi:phospholipid/cholesterol/gamma-HCH transport system ATP-binding protein